MEGRKKGDNDREGATGLMAYAVKQAVLWGRCAEVWDDRFKQEIWDLEFDVNVVEMISNRGIVIINQKSLAQ